MRSGSRKIILWRGYHSQSVLDLVRQTWERNDCLLLCPPQLREVDFLPYLPPGEIELAGEWGNRSEVFESPAYLQRLQNPLPVHGTPILGVFTTGTTQLTPKLVLYSKENIESGIAGVLSFFDRRRITGIFCYPQPFHVFGLNLGYVMAVLHGWNLHFNVGKYSTAAHKLRSEIDEPGLLTLGTPTHFQDLIDYQRLSAKKLTLTYSAILGGAKVTRELWLAVRDQLNINAPSIGYGATEASPSVTHLPPGHEPKTDGEIGFALPQLQIETRLGKGLICQGPSICLATVGKDGVDYPKSLALTDEVLRREDDGVFVFAGRSSLVLNRGGEKFSLERMENILKEKLGIAAVCVPTFDKRLVHELGIVVTQPVSFVEVTDVLRQEFGREFCQSRMITLASFPMNENSKIDRFQCAREIEHRHHAAATYPMDTAKLAAWVPHRPPMVWIDQVLWAEGEAGECLVRLDSRAHYFAEKSARQSSFIEWMAQAYGFIRASQLAAKNAPGFAQPKKAYLVGFRAVEFTAPVPITGNLIIHMKCIREMGPLAIIQGEVLTEDRTLLGRANLKVYAE